MISKIEPAENRAIDTEPRWETSDQDVVVNGVKGRREIKKVKACYFLWSYCIDEMKMIVNVQQSSFGGMMFTVGRK